MTVQLANQIRWVFRLSVGNKPKNSCAHVMPTEIFSRGHDFYKNDDKLDYSDGDIWCIYDCIVFARKVYIMNACI